MIPQALIHHALRHGPRARLLQMVTSYRIELKSGLPVSVHPHQHDKHHHHHHHHRLKHTDAKSGSGKLSGGAGAFTEADLLSSGPSSDFEEQSSASTSSPGLDAKTLLTDQDILKEPPRERFGILKAMVIIVAGIYFGAWLAMVGANVLEELEIFVQDEEEDDDD